MSGKKNMRIEVPNAGADLIIVEEPLQECPPSGLIIKTSSAGICQSDVLLYKDKYRLKDDVIVSSTMFSDKIKWPMVLGHEICGQVHAIGKEVPDDSKGLQVGDQVVVYPWINCDECALCKDGKNNQCRKGGMEKYIGTGAIPGGFQSYVKVEKTHHVLKVTKDIPSNVACMFGCGALTAYNAIAEAKNSIEIAAKYGEEARFLVIGAGGLGLWCIQLAKAVYPTNTQIFVADVSEEKLALAKEYGADEVILWPAHSSEEELVQKTKQITGAIDGCADFVAIPSTCNKALALANTGSTIVLVGLSGGTFPVPIFGLITRCVTLIGIVTGSRHQMAELVELYTTKKIKHPPIVNIQPEDANDSLRKLSNGQILGRAVISF